MKRFVKLFLKFCSIIILFLRLYRTIFVRYSLYNAALSMEKEKVLIVSDRGALDKKAYITDTEFNAVLGALGTNEIELCDGYDAAFHLVTTAKGAVEFYTTENNAARTETPEQAAALDDKLIAV